MVGGVSAAFSAVAARAQYQILTAPRRRSTTVGHTGGGRAVSQRRHVPTAPKRGDYSDLGDQQNAQD